MYWEGVVFDKVTNKGIPNATVTAYAGSSFMPTTTDQNGRWQMNTDKALTYFTFGGNDYLQRNVYPDDFYDGGIWYLGLQPKPGGVQGNQGNALWYLLLLVPAYFIFSKKR